MSLLNEALRKRSKETGEKKLVRPFSNEQRTRRTGRIIVYGVVIPFLLITFGGVMWVWQQFVRSDFFTESGTGPQAVQAIAPLSDQAANPLNDTKMDAPRGTEGMEAPAPDRTGRIETAEMQPRLPETPPTKAEPEGAAPETAENRPPVTEPSGQVRPAAAQPPVTEPSGQVRPPAARPDSGAPSPKTNVKRRNRSLKPKGESVQAGVRQRGDPSENPYYQKGLMYHRRNRLDQAIEMYEEVLKIHPDHRDTLLNLSAAFIENREFQKAYQILHAWVARGTKDPDVLINLAIAEMGLERPEGAVFYLEKAQQHSGGRRLFDIRFHRAAAFSRMGKVEPAMEAYKKAESMRPDHGLLLYNMAVAYDKLGRFPEAIRYYRRYAVHGERIAAEERQYIQDRIRRLEQAVDSGTGQTGGDGAGPTAEKDAQ